MKLSAIVHSRVALTFGVAFVLFVLLLQAQHPLWATHLSSDIGVFAQRVGTFLSAGSWAGLHGNEYQPGALFFFLVPYLLTASGMSYLSAFFLINAVLLVLHVVILRRLGGATVAWLGLLLFLAAGPISVFRFELLVSLLVLLAFVAWSRERSRTAGILLGLATMVKVYPLVLLPLFLRASKPTRGNGTFLRVLMGFGLGVVIVLAAFSLTGGSTGALIDSLTYHARKPVSVFSVLGGVALIADTLRGALPNAVNTYGIHGLLLGRPVGLLTTVGLLVSLVLLAVMRPRVAALEERRAPWMILLILGVLTSLVVWPTGFQPQYLLWPLAFTALLPVVGLPWSRVVRLVGAHAVALISIQFLYPVKFSEFLSLLYHGTTAPHLLVALAIFLGALMFLYVELWWEIFKRQHLAVPRTSDVREYSVSSPLSRE